MKSEAYKEIKEKLEKLKSNIPNFEKIIKAKKQKDIQNFGHYLIYLLHKIIKETTGKGITESIQDVSDSLWWFKMRKEKAEGKRKYMHVDKLYNEWAKKYDVDPNVLIFLEEQVSGEFIKDVRGKEVLDYGCGTGRYAIPLAKKGANVTAVDFSKEMLNIAKKKAKKAKANINFINHDITKYNPPNQFDTIISMLVLDHIKDLKNVVERLDKATKKGTHVVISNVHPELLRRNVDLKTGRAQGYLREERETNQYYHPVSEYVELMLKKGFILIKTKDLVYDRKYYSNKKLAKRFESFAGIKDKAIGIIMEFERIK